LYARERRVTVIPRPAAGQVDYRVNQNLAATLMHDTLASWRELAQAMNSPLTYPDERRDDNLVEFFLKLVGAILKKVLLAPLVWLFDALP
jgi:hypothetical protein